MHEHDLDLIAAYAEGSLTEDSEARSLIETCDQCHSEYEAQRAVLASLASAEPVTMTEQERATLHRDLWTELRAGTSRPGARMPWWQRLSYAAAGLFVVVGLAGVLSQLGGSSQSAATTALVGALTEGEDAASPAAEGGGATATTMAASPQEDGVAGGERGIDFYSALAEALRSSAYDASVGFSALYSNDDLAKRASACLAETGETGLEIVGTVDESTEFLTAVPSGEEIGPGTPVTFIDFATCEVVFVDG